MKEYCYAGERKGTGKVEKSICDLTEGDIVHNTLVALPTLQLDGSDLHQKCVLIAVELQQVVVQLGRDALLVPPVEATDGVG